MRVRDPLLGTRAEVEVRSGSQAEMDAGELAVLSEVERLEATFTLFDEASTMRQLRRSGKTDSPEITAVWELANTWYRRTNGVFHPAIQPLVDIWNEAERQGQLPSALDLTEVVASLDPTATAHLDFNALAKGWIADIGLTAAFTLDGTPTSAWLSLGGDLVHRGEGSVRVGIEDPARPYDNVPPLATVDVSNEALATSGTVHRFWTIQGTRYSRVLDPRSGNPVEHIRSATVIAETAATADVLATVALVLDPDEAHTLVESAGGESLLVTVDGEVLQSSDRFTRV